jgi:hypothetical protein
MGSPAAHLGRVGITPYDVVRIKALPLCAGSVEPAKGLVCQDACNSCSQ